MIRFITKGNFEMRNYACVIKKMFTIFAVLIFVWMIVEKQYYADTVPEPEKMLSLSEVLEDKRVDVTASATKDLLVFSYMRSGSSVTGGLLRDSPKTFYMYEPLIPLAPYSYLTDKLHCEMRNSDCSSTNAEVLIKQALLTLVNLYSCNMRAVQASVIDKIVKENKSGKPWEEFGKCLNSSGRRDKYSHIYIETTLSCFEQLERNCREADVKVAKVLRLGFETVGLLLESVPNLNVLFLTRDPRAIINSRIKTSWFPVSANEPKTVEDNVLSLCLKMENDLRAFDIAKSKYATRVRYSSLQMLASNDTALLGILKFVNKTVTTEDEKNVSNYNLKNSKKNITEKWRGELGSSYRRLVEKHCHYIIQTMTKSTGIPSNEIK